MSIEEPILSPVSVSDWIPSRLSQISDIDAGGSRVLQLTGDTEVLTPAKVFYSTTNTSDRLMSLVQPYHSLCHTIGTLREDINR